MVLLGTTSSTIGAGRHRLVIGKISRGSESDTIELYEPDAKMNLNQKSQKDARPVGLQP